ncbi:MAG: hypothetical protein JKY09_08510 [Crocinitomicaceae bacterium]|nr:hypothetical protein [Crocinitomicaceae bacterium]
MFKPTVRQVREVLASKKYKFFDGVKPFDLNIIGIRSASTLTNIFNETLMLIFKDELGEQTVAYFPFTTKAGLHYLKNPLNVKGCAITAEGQYLKSFIKRKHRGKYYALCQSAPINYYRDGNLNDKHELIGKVIRGAVGLNIHREHPTRVTQKIGKYSAGCGVIQSGFEYFMFLIDMGIKYWGNKFSYTLINEKDFYPEVK